MNCKTYNTAKLERDNNNDNSYYLSIRDNDTNVLEEMYLTAKEFMILDMAVRQNRGILNLLSNVETICGLFNKGLVTISDDKLRLAVVSDVIKCVLDPKATSDFTQNPFLEENKPNGFFKLFKNFSICFCCF